MTSSRAGFAGFVIGCDHNGGKVAIGCEVSNLPDKLEAIHHGKIEIRDDGRDVGIVRGEQAQCFRGTVRNYRLHAGNPFKSQRKRGRYAVGIVYDNYDSSHSARYG